LPRRGAAKGSEQWFEGRNEQAMTKVEAIIQNSKLEAVKNALQEIGVEGMTVLEARGHGRQKGHTEFYRGREYTVDLIPKVKLEMVLADTMVEKAVQAISEAARTGKIGDGKIFLSRVDEAIRIRNDERGEGAL
jgi:nitrogen regulatory protein P-II 1